MSDQQQILPCVQCNKHHEQMLMLSCLHDPCINCAAIHYVEHCQKNSYFYQCSKCKEETQLDSSSIIQLQRVYRVLRPVQDSRQSRKDQKKFQYNRSLSKNRQNSNPKPYYASEINGYRNQKPHTPTSYTQSMNYQPISPISPLKPSFQIGRRSLNQQNMCSEHPQDQLSYFCFSCNKPICPQCAIHGSHREHEVQTCRRSITAIKQRLNQANQSLTVEIGNINHKKNQIKQFLVLLSQTNKRDHQMIKRQFSKLKILLAQKQDEFLRVLNQNYQKNCEESKNFTEIMEKITKSYTIVRQTIDNTLKKDEITILNEFSKKQFQAQQIISQNSLISQQSRMKNTKMVDHKVFEDEINQISGFLENLKLALATSKNQF